MVLRRLLRCLCVSPFSRLLMLVLLLRVVCTIVVILLRVVRVMSCRRLFPVAVPILLPLCLVVLPILLSRVRFILTRLRRLRLMR